MANLFYAHKIDIFKTHFYYIEYIIVTFFRIFASANPIRQSL